MPGARKSKFAFRRSIALEAIGTSELDTAERVLAHLVALAYVGDHPDLFKPGIDERSGQILSPCEVPLMTNPLSAAKVARYD